LPTKAAFAAGRASETLTVGEKARLGQQGSEVTLTETVGQGKVEGMPDDQYAITFGDGPLGLDVAEIRFPLNAPPERQSTRIIVRGLKPGSQAETLGKEKRLRASVLVVSVDGFPIEGLPGKVAIKALQDAKVKADSEGRGCTIVFRDPLLFKEKLLNSQQGSSISTQVGPQSSEQLVINTTFSPPICGAVRAQNGDLLEVKYTGYLADTMEVFDGSSINAQGGFFGDLSIYFVLTQGQQQVPKAWEVGMLGMCIGEQRRLQVPPSLGYGTRGVPKGKIIPKLPVPPNATLIYDVTLVGINGINTITDDETSLGTRVPYDYRDCKTYRNGTTICGDDIKDKRL